MKDKNGSININYCDTAKHCLVSEKFDKITGFFYDNELVSNLHSADKANGILKKPNRIGVWNGIVSTSYFKFYQH